MNTNDLKNYIFYKNTSLIASFISLVIGLLAINRALFGGLYETTTYILHGAGIGFVIASIAFLTISNSYAKNIKLIKNNL